MTHQRTLTAAHWGVYEVEYDDNGKAMRLHPFSKDPDPSPIGLHMLSDEVTRLRVRRPAVRKSWLEKGPGAAPEKRGQEPFVELEWDAALDLVAKELKRVKDTHSNRAIFGGSYGWSSAGRFHHAQSQVHRFLNSVGGYVRHQDSYSLGAARVLMPHIVAPMDELMSLHTPWDVMAEHCKLFVSFGGVPHKNSQINAGGATKHHVKGGLYGMRAKGVRFVNVTPTADDLDTGGAVEWLAIRPNTDTALILALCHTLLAENLHDRDFLARYTVGFEKFAPSLAGKDAAWAEKITGIPASRIVALAREMAATRTTVSINWSLQRSHHGEQPFWAMITLACMLGQVGLPGGGFAVGYGPVNLMGSAFPKYSGPTLPQGTNAVSDFIPVARFTDMLLQPGGTVPYNGRDLVYPDIRLVYWAGGNPFHHHQDLNRLMLAWRKPETIVFHEQFWTPAARMADIVLPATTSLERDDIGYGSREPYLIAMKKAREPVGEARDDFWIFAELARAARPRRGLHRGPRHHGVAKASLRAVAREVGRGRRRDPGVRRVLAGRHRRGQGREPRAGDAGGLPRRSRKTSAQDAVGQDRDLLREDRLVRLRRLPGPRDLAGARRMAGLQDGRALSAAHAVGPAGRQAAQPARPQPAFARHQGQGPPAGHHASARTPPRAASPTAIFCACSTTAAPASRRRG